MAYLDNFNEKGSDLKASSTSLDQGEGKYFQRNDELKNSGQKIPLKPMIDISELGFSKKELMLQPKEFREIFAEILEMNQLICSKDI